MDTRTIAIEAKVKAANWAKAKAKTWADVAKRSKGKDKTDADAWAKAWSSAHVTAKRRLAGDDC